MKNNDNILAAFAGPNGLLRAAVPLAAIVLTLLCLLGALWDADWLWGLLITLPVLGVAAHDLSQRDYAVLRNYPVLGWFRYLFQDLRPFLRSYIV